MTRPARVYGAALHTPVLGRALNWLRCQPSVRRAVCRWRFARLAPGCSWQDLDSALRSLRGLSDHRVVFGPWTGSLELELSCWLPFVRWAVRHAELNRSQAVVATRGGTSRWYTGFAGTVHDVEPRDQRAVDALAPDSSRLDPRVLIPLWERYASGIDGIREILRRSTYERLPREAPPDPAAPLVTDLRFGEAFSETAPNRAMLERVRQALASQSTVDLTSTSDPIRRAELVAASAGIIATWTDAACLGPMLGVPTVVLRGAERSSVSEGYLDLARRIARQLDSAFTVVDAERLDLFAATFGSAAKHASALVAPPLEPVPSAGGREDGLADRTE
jgi:hypothetical protein